MWALKGKHYKTLDNVINIFNTGKRGCSTNLYKTELKHFSWNVFIDFNHLEHLSNCYLSTIIIFNENVECLIQIEYKSGRSR